MSDNAYPGFASLPDANSEFNQIDFLVRQILSKTATVTLVQIDSVQDDDAVAPVGLCNVKPLVGQIGADGKIVPHGVIHNVPFFRLQGGASAVIIDPKPGDIGIALFAAHDISTVKNTRTAAGPGSRRRFDWADALYVGGVLNGTPEQYVRFLAEGIEVVSATKVTVRAPVVEIDASTGTTVMGPTTLDGDVTITGNVSASGDFTDGSGLSLATHVHDKVTKGTDHSGGPLSPP
jgi:hypothetical protein